MDLRSEVRKRAAAYQQGAMDAAAFLDSMRKNAGMPPGADPGAGGPPPGAGGGMPPPPPPGADPTAGATGDPSIPGAQDGPPDLQEIAQLLMAAVQNGEIDQQTAEQVMQELASGGAGGAGGPPPGGDPGAGAGGPPPGAGGGMPPGAPPELPADAPPEAKAASVLVRELLTTK